MIRTERWTPAEDDLIQSWPKSRNHTLKQLAETLGRSYWATRHRHYWLVSLKKRSPAGNKNRLESLSEDQKKLLDVFVSLLFRVDDLRRNGKAPPKLSGPDWISYLLHLVAQQKII